MGFLLSSETPVTTVYIGEKVGFSVDAAKGTCTEALRGLGIAAALEGPTRSVSDSVGPAALQAVRICSVLSCFRPVL